MATIEIDGKPLEVENGKMIIEAADAAGIPIPRFCYHKKLSVAANCRMCLVQLEGSKKPVPACATPVANGMKILTKSEEAVRSQQAVMEFLLINHPLDCPICDQGGECELQDVSMGYGRGDSCFDERKRAVSSPDLGPLIETEMTRCIQCTRCVRFGEEIAGQRELGVINRGEKEAISTYIKTVVSSEVSGNVIDICPVGALTNKPFLYQARAWEMKEYPTISPHDCVGTNMFVHTRNEIEVPQCKVLRAVPRENEAVNETWMSDRDRFSVDSLYHEDRVYKQMVKRKNKWLEATWEALLPEISDKLRQLCQADPNKLGVIMSPSCTTEEYYLMQKIARRLGSSNIDHRLRCQDFSDEAFLPVFPALGIKIAELEQSDAVLLVGSNVRHEQPLLALRLVKACNEGAIVMAVNPVDYDYNFPVSEKMLTPGFLLVNALAEVAKAVSEFSHQALSTEAEKVCAQLKLSDEAKCIAKQLLAAKNGFVLLGAEAMQHPDAAQLKNWVREIAGLTGCRFGATTNGANAACAWLAGAVPHRGAAAATVQSSGLNLQQMLSKKLPAYILFNCDPEEDSAYPALAKAALDNAQCVICINTFMSQSLRHSANYILPCTPYTENQGTYVNVEGMMQRFKSSSVPFGDSRPGWKILRVLGNFLEFDGFGYNSNEEVTEELTTLMATMVKPEYRSVSFKPLANLTDDLYRLAYWPMYSNDPLVRRSAALQKTQDLVDPNVHTVAINQTLADQLSVKAGEKVSVTQAEQSQNFIVSVDDRLANNTVSLPFGIIETTGFGMAASKIELGRVEG